MKKKKDILNVQIQCTIVVIWWDIESKSFIIMFYWNDFKYDNNEQENYKKKDGLVSELLLSCPFFPFLRGRRWMEWASETECIDD